MDKSRVEPTIVFIENISFSMNLFSGHFYGQSFIKIVRGPSVNMALNTQRGITQVSNETNWWSFNESFARCLGNTIKL